MIKITSALDALDAEMLDRSGSVFYSSRPAFSGKRQIYLLGLNPGGDPDSHKEDTVGKRINEWKERTEPYSSYINEHWSKTSGQQNATQIKIQHLFTQLDADLLLTPASNVIFARTRSEDDLVSEKTSLLDICWPVHQAVIEDLEIDMIICLGQTAGNWVREKTGAHNCIAEFKEKYENRSWISTAHSSESGKIVITLTHPSRADWTNEDADPSPMIKPLLDMLQIS